MNLTIAKVYLAPRITFSSEDLLTWLSWTRTANVIYITKTTINTLDYTFDTNGLQKTPVLDNIKQLT